MMMNLIERLRSLPPWCYGNGDTRCTLLFAAFVCLGLIVVATIIWLVVMFYMYVVGALLALAAVFVIAAETVDDLRRLRASYIYPRRQ